MKAMIISALAVFVSVSALAATPSVTDTCLETVATATVQHLETRQPKSDVHLVKGETGRVIGLTDSKNKYGNFEIVAIDLPTEKGYRRTAKVTFSDSEVTAIANVEIRNYDGTPKCKVEGVASIESKAEPMTCTETPQSKKVNGYGRVLTIQVSNDRKSMKVTSPETADDLAIAEIVTLDDRDTSSDEFNLDEDYDRKKESRFFGSDELSSTDTGTCLIVEKDVLNGKSGKLRLSGGQGNEGDSGPPVIWYENAALSCR